MHITQHARFQKKSKQEGVFSRLFLTISHCFLNADSTKTYSSRVIFSLFSYFINIPFPAGIRRQEVFLRFSLRNSVHYKGILASYVSSCGSYGSFLIGIVKWCSRDFKLGYLVLFKRKKKTFLAWGWLGSGRIDFIKIFKFSVFIKTVKMSK